MPSSKSRRLRKKQQTRHRRLQMENLEDRRLLATFDQPILNFPSQHSDLGDFNLNPPDPAGAVGRDYYIQAVNSLQGSSVQIYNKADGSPAGAPFNMDSLSLGSGACSEGFGDPQISYDHLASRWVMLEFMDPQVINPITGVPNNGMCMYVSQTPDPTNGLWHSYEFFTQGFPDYPKLAIGADAYYVSTNEFNPTSDPAAYAFDRANMLAGLPARQFQRFSAFPLPGFGFQALAPATITGAAPPTGSPGYFARHVDGEFHGLSSDPLTDNIEIYEFKVDFDDPSQSSFTLVDNVPIDDFNSDLCAGGANLSCVPQPGTILGLDAIPQLIMHSFQYRNFGTHEALIGNFTYDIGGTNAIDQAGIRWFELRKEAGTGRWVKYQEGDIAPDSNHRFMGAIAMNGQGHIALGYSISSTVVSPGIRYTGRLAGDPLNTMFRGDPEVVAVNGRGSVNSNRYGDYAQMTVDPIDDTTFWITAEYADNGGWGTQIISFTFGDETPVDPGPSAEGSVSGTVFLDASGNNAQETGEKGIPGIPVYADLNNNFRFDNDEPGAITDRLGQYNFPVPLSTDTFNVRLSIPVGWQYTDSADNAGRPLTIDNALPQPQAFTDTNFALTGQLYDFGDAPAPYPVSMAQGGRHQGFDPFFRLGDSVTGEADGVNSGDAMGDAGDDGVTFPTALAAGQSGTVNVTVTTSGLSMGRLQGYIDFNQDGDWDDAGEKVISNLKLGDGTHPISISVPSTAKSGPTYARFVYGYEYDAGPTGKGTIGEVEDYEVFVAGINPAAVDDSASVVEGTNNNLIDVLLNDRLGASGTTKAIVPPGPNSATDQVSANGGIVAVVFDAGLGRNVIRYSPPANFTGLDTFTYEMTDGANNDTATVRVNVTPLFTEPIAVDDFFGPTFFTQAGTTIVSNQALDLFNGSDTGFGADIVGQNGPIAISNLTEIVDPNGTVVGVAIPSPTEAGSVNITLNPGAGFNGVATFDYTIADQVGATSTATVTLSTFDTNADDDIIALTPFITPTTVPDTNGNGRIDPSEVQAASVTAVPQGEFLLHVFADDLRMDPNADGVPADLLGVFSAYLDVLFDRTKLSVAPTAPGTIFDPVNGTNAEERLGFPIDVGFNFDIPSPTGGNLFPEQLLAQLGDVNTPGVINDVGAAGPPAASAASAGIYGLDNPPGDLLFTVRLVTDPTAVGATSIQLDPTIVPSFETAIFEPPTEVPVDRITFGSIDFNIIGNAGSPPVALDDSFSRAQLDALGTPAPSQISIDVLANDDVTGSGMTGSIVSVTQPSNGSIVNFVPGSNSPLVYQPATSNGVPVYTNDSFTYTIQNNDGLQDTATVLILPSAEFTYTVLVDGAPAPDVNGDGIPEARVGQEVTLTVTANDLRAAAAKDGNGFLSAGLDVMYNNTLLDAPDGPDNTESTGDEPVDFGPIVDLGGASPIQGFRVGDGLLDDLVIFGTAGLGETVELFSVTFNAIGAGTAQFVGAAPDPTLEISFFEPTTPVTGTAINFGNQVIEILPAAGAGSAEGEGSGNRYTAFTNKTNYLDVNNDGRPTLLDAFNIVSYTKNRLDTDVSHVPDNFSDHYDVMYRDVNGDGRINTTDIGIFINGFNRYRRALQLNDTEGEGSPANVDSGTAFDVALLDGSSNDRAQRAALDSEASVDSPTNAIDSIFAAEDSGNGSSSSGHVTGESSRDTDDLLTDDLLEDVISGWLN